MTQRDLKALAKVRIDDAVLLLKHKRYCAAYYLSGYGIELALKAVIAPLFLSNCIPDQSLVKEIYTHNFETLVNLAELSIDLEKEKKKSVDFSANWAIAVQWLPESRYRLINSVDAEDMVTAICFGKDCVFKWITSKW